MRCIAIFSAAITLIEDAREGDLDAEAEVVPDQWGAMIDASRWVFLDISHVADASAPPWTSVELAIHGLATLRAADARPVDALVLCQGTPDYHALVPPLAEVQARSGLELSRSIGVTHITAASAVEVLAPMSWLLAQEPGGTDLEDACGRLVVTERRHYAMQRPEAPSAKRQVADACVCLSVASGGDAPLIVEGGLQVRRRDGEGCLTVDELIALGTRRWSPAQAATIIVSGSLANAASVARSYRRQIAPERDFGAADAWLSLVDLATVTDAGDALIICGDESSASVAFVRICGRLNPYIESKVVLS